MSSWLVESYWPPAAGSPGLAAERLRALDTDRDGVARLVGGVHLPGDEIVLWRFEADEPEAIRRQMDAAGIAYERIVEAVDMP